MTSFVIPKEHNSIIRLIRDCGINVVLIAEEYYSVSEFNPADNVTHYHHLNGTNITTIVKNHANVVHTDKVLQTKVQELLQAILVSESEILHFHKDIQFIYQQRLLRKTNY